MDLIPCLAARSGSLEPVRRDSAGPAIEARNTNVPEPFLNSSIAANEWRPENDARALCSDAP
jgi:hypothetical protein